MEFHAWNLEHRHLMAPQQLERHYQVSHPFLQAMASSITPMVLLVQQNQLPNLSHSLMERAHLLLHLLLLHQQRQDMQQLLIFHVSLLHARVPLIFLFAFQITHGISRGVWKLLHNIFTDNSFLLLPCFHLPYLSPFRFLLHFHHQEH